MFKEPGRHKRPRNRATASPAPKETVAPIQAIMNATTFRSLALVDASKVYRRRKDMTEEGEALTKALKDQRRELETAIGDTAALKRGRWPSYVSFISDYLDAYHHLVAQAESSTTLRDNIWDRLVLLRDIEAQVFRWNSENPIPMEALDEAREMPYLDVYSVLLDEIQEERATLTQELRAKGLPMCPTYMYKTGKPGDAAKPKKKAGPVSADFEEGQLPSFLRTSVVSEAKNQKEEMLYRSWVGQLMSFPTGLLLLTEHARKTRSFMGSAMKVKFGGLGGKPEFSTSGVFSKEYVLPRSLSATEYMYSYSSSSGNSLSFYPPYITFARALAQFTGAMSQDEAERRLFFEAGLPQGRRKFHRRNADNEAVALDYEEIGTTGAQVPPSATSENTGAEGPPPNINFDTVKDVRVPLAVSGFRFEELDKPDTEPENLFGVRPQPAAAAVYRNIFFMTFNPELLDPASIKKFGEQGEFGFVFECQYRTDIDPEQGTPGAQFIVKFPRSGVGELEQWAKHHEKQAFASNFIRMMGHEATAPASVPLPKDSEMLRKMAEVARQGSSADAEFFAHICTHNVGADEDAEEKFKCIVMERVKGYSYEQIEKKIGKHPTILFLKNLFRRAEAQRALGELLLHDLLLGNFDRFWQGMHAGNVLFDLEFKGGGPDVRDFGESFSPYRFKDTPNAINGLDQTLSAYGMHLLLRSIEDPTTLDRYRAEEEEFLWTARVTEDYERNPLAFQAFASDLRTRLAGHLRSYIQAFLRRKDKAKAGEEVVGKISLTRRVIAPVMGREAEHVDTMAMDIGFMEALLRLKTKAPLLENMRKARFDTFQHEAVLLFNNWQTAIDVLNEFNEREIVEQIASFRQFTNVVSSMRSGQYFT
ncbi:hypothetical protein FUAX_45700 (plasmid) [Fulvitalea axinellae]|uniref:Uncharacterized protein n=1 Tax=Fulvitalea axinellae TaxID=1182444 RepID=A0AAU9CVV4_9BACT|nr:hypothetical protein FUAX_45700 [Fulvitalea axinellae]